MPRDRGAPAAPCAESAPSSGAGAVERDERLGRAGDLLAAPVRDRPGTTARAPRIIASGELPRLSVTRRAGGIHVRPAAPARRVAESWSTPATVNDCGWCAGPIGSRSATASRSSPAAASKRKPTRPGCRPGRRGSRTAPRARGPARASPRACRCPSSFTPVAVASTDGLRGASPVRALTTTPAANRSPSRRKRGSAGRATSGRVTSSDDSPLAEAVRLRSPRPP